MSHAPEEVKRAAKALNTIVRNLKTYAADPEFWPKDTKDPALDKFLGALRSNSPEAVGKHMLAELHNNKTRIEKAREAEAAPKPTQAQLNAEAEAIKAEDLASQGAQ
jgi:hypothetical protein